MLKKRNIGINGGHIISCTASARLAEHCFDLPSPAAFEAWCACRRTESCWMTPTTGTRIADVPAETQMLLFKQGDFYTVYIPLVKGRFRVSLFSNETGRLQVRVESGSPDVTAQDFDVVYVNTADNPYSLFRAAATDLKDELGTFNLPEESQRPQFMNYYGWCSWNAFYEKVSEDNIHLVLDQFQKQGFVPGFLIVDAGWQSTKGNYLTGYESNAEKFPNGMQAAINGFKERAGVHKVLLWQTYNGYWNGLDPATLPNTYRADMDPPQRLLSGRKKADAGGSGVVDTMSGTFYPEHILDKEFWHPDSYEAFYDEYHHTSAAAGADGVKIDAITWIEACGKGRGGRVAMMQEFLRAAEKSVARYFNGDAIWCSSCSNDFLFNTKGGGVVRTSTDFFPNKPETHGLHIYANAINTLFMGAFVRPDWDMFQSALGAPSAFHAAARAISGGPVYSTDAFGQENFDLIRKLVQPDGTVPLCEETAQPTIDCIFQNPQIALLKIFNRNRANHILGVFNAAYEGQQDALRTGTVSVEDVYPLHDSQAEYALYRHGTQSIHTAKATDALDIELGTFGFELFTIGEIRNGFAPIGDPGLYNSGGVVRGWETEGTCQKVMLQSSNRFIAYADKAPTEVTFEGRPIDFEWDARKLNVALPAGFKGTLGLAFQTEK